VSASASGGRCCAPLPWAAGRAVVGLAANMRTARDRDNDLGEPHRLRAWPA
jgi:hypothetical protein